MSSTSLMSMPASSSSCGKSIAVLRSTVSRLSWTFSSPEATNSCVALPPNASSTIRFWISGIKMQPCAASITRARAASVERYRMRMTPSSVPEHEADRSAIRRRDVAFDVEMHSRHDELQTTGEVEVRRGIEVHVDVLTRAGRLVVGFHLEVVEPDAHVR